jgi:hypothetical protein
MQVLLRVASIQRAGISRKSPGAAAFGFAFLKFINPSSV